MKVVGVKVNGSNKTVYYNDNDLNLKINLTVIVNTDRGLQFGTVCEFSEDDNFDKYEDVDIKTMGFVEEWYELLIR